MALPGVSRNERIKFVEHLVGLLLKEGLEEITKTEYDGLNKMISEIMNSVTPVEEDVKKSDNGEKPGGC
ncbi:MAG: hypothetical protein KAS73_10625 [Candidatus Sabulitectum sp.]|nr:hypothetical protein [Candidatus Sabulitectum sp.]